MAIEIFLTGNQFLVWSDEAVAKLHTARLFGNYLHPKAAVTSNIVSNTTSKAKKAGAQQKRRSSPLPLVLSCAEVFVAVSKGLASVLQPCRADEVPGSLSAVSSHTGSTGDSVEQAEGGLSSALSNLTLSEISCSNSSSSSPSEQTSQSSTSTAHRSPARSSSRGSSFVEVSRQTLNNDHFRVTPRQWRRCVVFSDLHRRGFCMTSGLKFGGDFLVYPRGSDPSSAHSRYIACVLSSDDAVSLSSPEMVARCRVASTVKKTLLFSIVKDDSHESPSVEYLEVFGTESGSTRTPSHIIAKASHDR